MHMIKSFRGSLAEAVFRRTECRAVPEEIRRAAYRRLLSIDIAVSLRDLGSPPGNRLEKLSGDRSGRYSIRINERWRICFAWSDGHAYDVEIVDYH
jgi:proteic killer suppression protein